MLCGMFWTLVHVLTGCKDAEGGDAEREEGNGIRRPLH